MFARIDDLRSEYYLHYIEVHATLLQTFKLTAPAEIQH